MIVNKRNATLYGWTIPYRYNCTDCKVYAVGRAALPTPTSPESSPGKTEGPATKLPRHCEGQQARGNPVDFPGCSVDHGIATPSARNDVVFDGWSFLSGQGNCRYLVGGVVLRAANP